MALIMRWLAIWLLLTLTYAAGWLASGWLLGGPLRLSREVLAHFAVVPLAQVAALALVAALRKSRSS
jgi:hypothetical protein